MKIILNQEKCAEFGADIMQVGIILNILEEYKNKASLDPYHKVALNMWIEYFTTIANELYSIKPNTSFNYDFDSNFKRMHQQHGDLAK